MNIFKEYFKDLFKNLKKRSLKGVLKGTVESTKMRAHFVESTKCARKSSKKKEKVIWDPRAGK